MDKTSFAAKAALKVRCTFVSAMSVFAAIAALMLVGSAWAAEETVNGYTWTYRLTADGKGAELYNGEYAPSISPDPEGPVAIPAKLGGKPVVSIGDYAFFECENMTAVTIPATVTSLGKGAFEDCIELEHIALPTKLATIGVDAFRSSAIRSLVIPDGVTSIAETTFFNAQFLECVQFGKKVNVIGSKAFMNCYELTRLVFKGNAPQVGEETFKSVSEDCEVWAPKNSKGWINDCCGFGFIAMVWQDMPFNYGDCKVNVPAEAYSVKGGSGTVTGGGEYVVGKKVAFKAKADSGSVFCGWMSQDLLLGDTVHLSYSTSYSDYVVSGESIKFVGRFITVQEDIDHFALKPLDVTTDFDGTLDLDLTPYVATWSEPKLTFKNLPAGLKYDAKTFKIAGKATKPGIYKVTVSATNVSVKKAITAEWTITVPNFWDGEVPVDGYYGDFIPGVAYADMIAGAEDCTVTGLPAGMKWTSRDINDKTLGVISAYSYYGAPTKPGYYTVYFTKTVKDGGKSVKHTSTATFCVAPFPKLTIKMEGASGKDKVTGEGEYAANKKVTLKATPDTSKDNPKVFMGWYDDSDNLLSQSATYSYEMPSVDTVLKAKFITQKEDSDNIFVGVGPLDYSDFDGNLEAVVFLPCGVKVDWPIVVDALSQTTVKVSGLPAGMKYTAKEVIDPKTKDVIASANSIYGAPAADSKTKLEMGMTRKVPSDVKIEVTTSGKTKKTYVIKTYVEAMQPWAVGTFNGGTVAKDGDVYDLSSMTVASTGNISGKINNEDGSSWQFSAAAFEEYDPDEEKYSALVDIKQGPASGPSWVTITRKDGLLAEVKFTAFNPADMLYNSPWKSDPLKTLAKKFTTAAAKTLEIKDVADREGNPGTLTLQFDASGAVKAKGVFTVGGTPYTASCSSVVTPITDIIDSTDEFDAYLYLLLPYKAGKFEGYGARLELHWDGTAFSLK